MEAHCATAWMRCEYGNVEAASTSSCLVVVAGRSAIVAMAQGHSRIRHLLGKEGVQLWREGVWIAVGRGVGS